MYTIISGLMIEVKPLDKSKTKKILDDDDIYYNDSKVRELQEQKGPSQGFSL